MFRKLKLIKDLLMGKSQDRLIQDQFNELFIRLEEKIKEIKAKTGAERIVGCIALLDIVNLLLNEEMFNKLAEKDQIEQVIEYKIYAKQQILQFVNKE